MGGVNERWNAYAKNQRNANLCTLTGSVAYAEGVTQKNCLWKNGGNADWGANQIKNLKELYGK